MVNPTPYADVNAILGLLLARVERILGDQFTGMYLYGSLSSGDFDGAQEHYRMALKASPESATITFMEAVSRCMSAVPRVTCPTTWVEATAGTPCR